MTPSWLCDAIFFEARKRDPRQCLSGRQIDADLHLNREANLAEALGRMVNGLIAQLETSNMLGKGVFQIDLHQFAPDPASFLGLVQRAERDSKKGERGRSWGRAVYAP